MELCALRTLQWTAQLKSLPKVTAVLGYTQAAVTIQIQQLKKELHTRLFDHSGKTISPTQQGAIFCDYTCHILDEDEKAKPTLQKAQELEGHLHTGMTRPLCASSFPKLLHTSHTTYPYISISTGTSSPETLLDMMNHSELDIVYFIDRRQYHPDWIRIVDEPEEIVFVYHPSYALAKRKPLTFKDLLQEELIPMESAASYRYELDQYTLSIKQQVRPRLEIGNTEFIIRELLGGCEISLLLTFCVQPYIDQGRLFTLWSRDFQLHVYRQTVYHKSKQPAPHTSVFLFFTFQWI